MGSWSVYCGISKIAITDGQKCVLIPIKKNHMRDSSYSPYLAATLPIFGEYNDYGQIENIERNRNTEIIEDHFGCTIENFATYFTDETTYNRGVVSEDNFKNFDEMKNWNFMFVDREVYDFMCTPNDHETGHLEYGHPDILKLLGFTHQGIAEDQTRFVQKWTYDDKVLYSDGRWAIVPETNEGIYYFRGSWGALTNYVTLPEDKLWIGTKTMSQLWRHLDDETIKRKFLPTLSGDRYNNFSVMLRDFRRTHYGEEEEEVVEPTTYASIVDYYEAKLREVGDEFADLGILNGNLYPMSGTLEPYIIYLTPQCGEHKRHQVILEKFAEINKSKMRDWFEEDEE